VAEALIHHQNMPRQRVLAASLVAVLVGPEVVAQGVVEDELVEQGQGEHGLEAQARRQEAHGQVPVAVVAVGVVGGEAIAAIPVARAAPPKMMMTTPRAMGAAAAARISMSARAVAPRGLKAVLRKAVVAGMPARDDDEGGDGARRRGRWRHAHRSEQSEGREEEQ
jgi:L-fucose isomerase-like protein